jgi:hypothetical protein
MDIPVTRDKLDLKPGVWRRTRPSGFHSLEVDLDQRSSNIYLRLLHDFYHLHTEEVMDYFATPPLPQVTDY